MSNRIRRMIFIGENSKFEWEFMLILCLGNEETFNPLHFATIAKNFVAKKWKSFDSEDDFEFDVYKNWTKTAIGYNETGRSSDDSKKVLLRRRKTVKYKIYS